MADGKSAEKTVLLIVGKAGNGKSSTGNSILRVSSFQAAHSFRSNDVELQIETEDNLEVICAPDLHQKKFILEKEKKEFDPEEEVKSWFDQIKIETVSAVVLVIRCDVRFTPDASEAYEQLKRSPMLKELMKEKLVLVFTMGDRLNGRNLRMDLESDESYLQPLQAVWKDAKKRFVVFDNTVKKDLKLRAQVEALMRVVKTMEPHPYPQHICRLLFVGPEATLKKVQSKLSIRKFGFGIAFFEHMDMDGFQLEMTFLPTDADQKPPKSVRVALSPGPHAILDFGDNRSSIKSLFSSSYKGRAVDDFTKTFKKDLSDFKPLKTLLLEEDFPAMKLHGEFFQDDELRKIYEEVKEKTMRETESSEKAAGSSYKTYLSVKRNMIG